MTQILIKDGLFVTMQDTVKMVQGHMLVTNNLITYIGEDEPDNLEEDVEIIAGKGLVFMPGLVNTHGHTAMSLLRGYADDLNLQVWLEQYMWPMEAKFSEADTRAGSVLSIAEMLLSGTTAFVDMYDRMEIVAEEVSKSGIRGSLMRGVIGLCSDEEKTFKLNEAVNFAKEWNNKADGRIRTMLAPHAPYTCDPAYITRFIQASHDLQVPLHTHMSESIAEVEQNVRDYGKRPVAHLNELGFFDRPSLVAHAVHLNDEEINILAEKQVSVSHNPISNLKLASGIARIPELVRAGVKVGLGTDSSASNNNLDLFEEIRMTALIHKGVSYDPTVIPAYQALQLATSYGAESIWLGQEIGTLQVGKKADFIALNIDQPHFYPHTDMISHLAYSANGKDVQHVWVDGKQLVKNRQLLTIDYEKAMHDAQASYERLKR